MAGRHYGDYRPEESIRLRPRRNDDRLGILRPTHQGQTMLSQP
jgi:hypothetical protein